MQKKIFKTIAMVFVCATLALGCATFVGCGDDTPKVNSIKLNKNELILMEKDTEKLSATVDPSGISVTWSSSDSSKVIVDQTGKVVGISETTTPVTVTATAGDKSATCTVVVTPRPVEYEEVASVQFKVDDLLDTSSEDTSYKETLKLNENNEFTEEIALKNNLIYLTAADTDSNGKILKKPSLNKRSTGGITFGDKKDGKTFHESIKTGGKGTIENASIKLVLEKGAKIAIYCRNGSNAKSNIITLFNSNFQKLGNQSVELPVEETSINSKDRLVPTYTTTKGGTYYISSENASLLIYAIDIFYEI